MNKIIITPRHKKFLNREIVLGNSVEIYTSGKYKGDIFCQCKKTWDSIALNNLRQPGAVVLQRNNDAIARAVKKFKSEHPGADVQDNS